MPMASTRPKSVSVLIEKSSAAKAANVPMSEIARRGSGSAWRASSAGRGNTTSVTSTKAMKSVFTTSFSDSVTNGVVV